MSKNFTALRSIYPALSLRCCYCPNEKTCSNVSKQPDISYQNDFTEEGLVHIGCNVCYTNWKVCVKCAGFKTCLRDSRMVSRHRHSCHRDDNSEVRNNKRGSKSSEKLSNDTKTDVIAPKQLLKRCLDQISEPPEPIENLYRHLVSGRWQHNGTDLKICPLNKTTATFPQHEHDKKGANHLIATAINSNMITRSNITSIETGLHLLIAKHAMSLTEMQRLNFSDVLHYLRRCWAESFDDKDLQAILTHIPAQKTDIDRLYITSPTSVTTNLPHPTILNMENHAMVYLHEIISDFMWKNAFELVDLDNWTFCVNKATANDDCKRFFSNMRSTEIIDKCKLRQRALGPKEEKLPIIPIFLTFWNDDFDPNKSIKANRQSVWIKTCTISVLCPGPKLVSSTYPIAVSEKGADHDEVEEKFKNELYLLAHNKFVIMYSRFHRQPVYVHAELFCHKMDQPERRSSLKLMAGNSDIHGRYGYLFDFKNNVDIIRSCEECSNSINNEVLERKELFYLSSWRQTTCQVCSAWMYDVGNVLLQFDVDNDYPKDALNENGKLYLSRVNLNRIVEMTGCVYRKMIDPLHEPPWTLANCRSYLKYSGLNIKTQRDAIQLGKNSRASDDAIRGPDRGEQFETLRADKRNNPKKYDMWNVPPAWYYFNHLNVFVDVPMHLLFLGVVRTTVKALESWLKTKRLLDPFGEQIKDLLLPIKLLNLSWCKVLNDSGDSFGGWVSENYVALCRLSNWFYSSFELLKKKDKVDPDTPYNTWKKPEHLKWLGNRNLDKSRTAQELKDRVALYFETEMEIPDIIPDDSSSCDRSHVLLLINLMHQMVTKCMTVQDEQGVDYLEAVIRCYFIHYDKFILSISKRDTVGWITSYNFLSLLNIPDLLRRYGSMRPLWEGGKDGESYLKLVKKELKTGLVRQWQVWLLKKFLDGKTFQHMIKKDNRPKQQVREFKVYGSKNVIKKLLRENKIISGFKLDNNSEMILHVAYRHEGEINACRLYTPTTGNITRNYEDYFPVTMSKLSTVLSDFLNTIIGTLLLPYLKTGEERPLNRLNIDHYFCVISSNWT